MVRARLLGLHALRIPPAHPPVAARRLSGLGTEAVRIPSHECDAALRLCVSARGGAGSSARARLGRATIGSGRGRPSARSDGRLVDEWPTGPSVRRAPARGRAVLPQLARRQTLAPPACSGGVHPRFGPCQGAGRRRAPIPVGRGLRRSDAAERVAAARRGGARRGAVEPVPMAAPARLADGPICGAECRPTPAPARQRPMVLRRVGGAASLRACDHVAAAGALYPLLSGLPPVIARAGRLLGRARRSRAPSAPLARAGNGLEACLLPTCPQSLLEPGLHALPLPAPPGHGLARRPGRLGVGRIRRDSPPR